MSERSSVSTSIYIGKGTALQPILLARLFPGIEQARAAINLAQRDLSL